MISNWSSEHKIKKTANLNLVTCCLWEECVNIEQIALVINWVSVLVVHILFFVFKCF